MIECLVTVRVVCGTSGPFGGGGAGTGGNSRVNSDVGFGNASGHTIGARIILATSATCPVTPAHVVQNRLLLLSS